MTLLARQTARFLFSKPLQQTRASLVATRGYSGPAVDYDHFSHGWAVGDLGDFTGKGKYAMQTFNKISPKVSERRRYKYKVVPRSSGKILFTHIMFFLFYDISSHRVSPSFLRNFTTSFRRKKRAKVVKPMPL